MRRESDNKMWDKRRGGRKWHKCRRSAFVLVSLGNCIDADADVEYRCPFSHHCHHWRKCRVALLCIYIYVDIDINVKRCFASASMSMLMQMLSGSFNTLYMHRCKCRCQVTLSPLYIYIGADVVIEWHWRRCKASTLASLFFSSPFASSLLVAFLSYPK